MPHDDATRVLDFEPPTSFNSWGALRNKSSRVICVWCHAVWFSDFTMKFLKTVVCTEGVFRAASNDHLAYWLLHPPSGHWLFLQGDAKKQHVAWCATVNTSPDIYTVQAGESALPIRRGYLLQGADAWRRLVDAANAADPKKSRKSPFLSLSRDRDSCRQGQITPSLVALAERNEAVAVDITFMNRLTSGERWALTAVMYSKAPSRPEPEATPLSTHTD